MYTKQNIPQWIGVLLLLIVLMIIAGCSEDSTTSPQITDKVTHEETATHDLDLTGVDHVDASTANGLIAVSGQASKAARLEVHTTVRAATIEEAERVAATIQVDVEIIEGELVITANYPQPELGIDVIVDYDLACPAALSLDLQAANGEISVVGTSGAVLASLANGRIAVTLDGDLDYELKATIVNGCIVGEFEGTPINVCRTSIQRGTPDGIPCDLRVVNGTIELSQN